jgi:malonyl-CoA/methylmalonyl-CoA synthetase
MFRAIENALLFAERTALVCGDREYTYAALSHGAREFAGLLLNGRSDLEEGRIAFMVDPGFEYVKVQWAVWQAGGVAVPLCITHPFPSLQYVLEDTGAETVVASVRYMPMLEAYCVQQGIRLFSVEAEVSGEDAALPHVEDGRMAMILYTSGTTSKPKGVVTTHANLNAQVSTLIEAWHWHRDDRILCVLPLHHVHGIVNVVCCALYSGACCRFLPDFSGEAVFRYFLEGRLSVFMAVPTIYFKLIAYWETLSEADADRVSVAMRAFRLMVSGSAALPVAVMERWKAISGHSLLERYGMTEIGMAISNPYEGERRPGHVGMPLPGVDIRIAEEQGLPVPEGEPGEILVRGDNVFTRYWNRQEATQEAFTADGWFRTGDVAVVEDGYIRILGRNSVDIIKSGGYKISALEIEEVLRTHPGVKDCAVVALPDEEWGERIVAALVTDMPGPDPADLDRWMRAQMASYKVPRRYLNVEELPRNTMGKVLKAEVKQLFS